jgi:hypothetical protein
MEQDILNRVYKKSDDIIHRRIADETILVPLRGELVDMQKIFSLNPVADYVWEHLDGKRNLMEICNRVDHMFESVPEQVRNDVLEFIGELVEAKLITEVEP